VIFLDIVIGGELLDYYLRRDGAVLASTHLKLWPRSKRMCEGTGICTYVRL
jgi:hypothetical protein